MTDKELAIKIAKRAFEEKKDKAGKPYIEHLLRVAERFNNDEFLYTIAILHDLLEDCPEWSEKTLRCVFSESVVNTVVILTKKKNQDYFEYIDQILQSSWSTRVKIYDLKDNLDITRLDSVSTKDIDRINKYLKALKILTDG